MRFDLSREMQMSKNQILQSVLKVGFYLVQASCRRNFNLEVALMDALGRPVHREIDVSH